MKPHRVNKESLTFVGICVHSQKLLNDHGITCIQLLNLYKSTSFFNVHLSSVGKAGLPESSFVENLQDCSFVGNARAREN